MILLTYGIIDEMVMIPTGYAKDREWYDSPVARYSKQQEQLLTLRVIGGGDCSHGCNNRKGPVWSYYISHNTDSCNIFYMQAGISLSYQHHQHHHQPLQVFLLDGRVSDPARSPCRSLININDISVLFSARLCSRDPPWNHQLPNQWWLQRPWARNDECVPRLMD